MNTKSGWILFYRLRKAMRITLPENKRWLNDNGEHSATMKTIEKEVGKFRAWLTKSGGYSKHKEYRKLVEQLDTYGEKLFADPIVADTAAGAMLIQPQRTNNIVLPAGFHNPQDPVKPFPGCTNGGFAA